MNEFLKEMFLKNPLKTYSLYEKFYLHSIKRNEDFWMNVGEILDWEKKYDVANSSQFLNGPSIDWYRGGELNVSYNSLDRHLKNDGASTSSLNEKTAIIYEADCGKFCYSISYQNLLKKVSKLSNVLKSLGIQKNEIITIYMPMVPSAVIAMLASSRLALTHSVVFSGFSSNALAERLSQSKSKIIITTELSYRRKKKIKHFNQVLEALNLTENYVETVILIDEIFDEIFFGCEINCECHSYLEKKLDSLKFFNFNDKDDDLLRRSFDEGVIQINENVVPIKIFKTSNNNSVKILNAKFISKFVPDECSPVFVESNHPLFLLYTSGSTGKPKGVIHSSGGYAVYAAFTSKIIFDLKKETDVYFCTADIGWITGHTYGVYGPLLNGVTLLLFGGVPDYPHNQRIFELIERHSVSIFYTAPTAVRMLMRLNQNSAESLGQNSVGLENDSSRKNFNLDSIRVLGSVGEPIDKITWEWFKEVLGQKKAPIMDTWWQTETGGVMIAPIQDVVLQTPSVAGLPFFGILPALISNENETPEGLDSKQNRITNSEGKSLCIEKSWPGQSIGIFNDHHYFEESYFKKNIGFYTSGDGAKINEKFEIIVLGRLDDVLNVSGHRLNSAELEQAVNSHENVLEVAVVGFLDEIKGEGIAVFITQKKSFDSCELSESLMSEEIKLIMRKMIGPIAAPDKIFFVPDLPKTRSGKIVRRLLRKILNGEEIFENDCITVSNVESLPKIQNIVNKKL